MTAYTTATTTSMLESHHPTSRSQLQTPTDLSPCENVSGLSSGWKSDDGRRVQAGPSIHFPTCAGSAAPVPSPIPRAVQALRSRHSRTRSAAALSSEPKTLYTASLRMRAASTTESSTPSTRHLRTMSFSQGILPRVEPVLSLTTDMEETIGSFSPTSCPRQHLHHILGERKPSRLRFNSLRTVPSMRLKLPFDLDLAAADNHRSGVGADDNDDRSSQASPVSPIPSICRTPSSYSESEYFPTAPSSAGPVTPVHSNSSSPELSHKSLRPILEALEDASKFRVQTSCSNCHKAGSNFPCCPRCGEMWCSRECRVRSTGGKRHICSAGRRS